ncbi:MAG: DUF2975 domain-containing protein [Sphingobacteriaceae bacterium]|nr:DUF2975 domain-containing protein [Sphingobacteriaceae bacterium]
MSTFTVGSIIGMWSESRSVEVVSKKTHSKIFDSNEGKIRRVKESGYYSFKTRNIFDRIFMNKKGYPDILTCIITLAIMWQAFKVFEALKLEAPFLRETASRIKKLGILIITAWVTGLIKNSYTRSSIWELTNEQYHFDAPDSVYSLGLGIIMLIIAAVYKRGCELQEDRDLTV